MTDHFGTVAQRTIYYPWGQLWASAGSVKEERFASLGVQDPVSTADVEGTLESALFRFYHPRLGRWLSPDRRAGSAFNPQSLNRYAYVLNNPTNGTDPLGLDSCTPQLVCTTVDGVQSCTFTIYCTSTAPTGADIGAGGGSPEESVPTPTGRGGEPDQERGDAVAEGISPKKYRDCAREAFAATSGKIPGTIYNIPRYLASVYVALASDATGESAAIIGATLLIESGGNLSPLNNLNTNGTVDVGPMQLNASNLGEPGFPIQAYGPDLVPKHKFRGDPYANILAGASYLQSLGTHPENYVGAKGAATRLGLLNNLTRRLKPFFDCLSR